MVNPAINEGLPGFLVQEGGLNSGFMIMHCTAAALASENKSLCHPASVDSISTSAAKEGTASYHRCRRVVVVKDECDKMVGSRVRVCGGWDRSRVDGRVCGAQGHDRRRKRRRYSLSCTHTYPLCE